MDAMADHPREGRSPQHDRSRRELRQYLFLHTMTDADLETAVETRCLDLAITLEDLYAGNFARDSREVLDNSLEWLMAELDILKEEQQRRAHAAAARQRAAASGRPRRDLGERFAAARALDCAELLRALTGQPGRGSGQTRMFSCPLHEDRSPSLITYPPGRGWYCFSCHQGGDAVALLTAITPMSRMDALRLLEQGAVGGITPRAAFATTPEVH